MAAMLRIFSLVLALTFGAQAQTGFIPFSVRLPVRDSLVLWLDAADISTITKTADSGFVTQWNAKGSRGYVFAQSKLSRRPRWRADSLGRGKPCINYIANEDLFTDTLNIFQTSGQMDVFAVMRVWNTFDVFAGGTTNSGSITIYPTAYGSFGYFLQPTVFASAGTSAGFGTAAVMNIQRKPSTDTAYFYYNGSKISQIKASGIMYFTHLGQNRILGDKPRGSYGEVLVYNRNLTDSERAATVMYLKSKWGL